MASENNEQRTTKSYSSLTEFKKPSADRITNHNTHNTPCWSYDIQVILLNQTKMQSTATKKRTKSDIKLAQDQATLQAISVIQTTIQCGIAQVCFSRNLFPTSFFRHMDMSARGNGIGNSNSNSNGNGSQNGDCIVVFDLDQDSVGSTSQRSQGGGGEGSSGSGSSETGALLDHSQESNLPLFSPLTCEFNDTLSVYTHGNSQLQHHREKNRRDTELYTGDAFMKAEVRLLLHWVQGLWDILHDSDRRNSLVRVIFGICKPGKDSDSSSVAGDRVLESFAVSHLSYWQLHFRRDPWWQ